MTVQLAIFLREKKKGMERQQNQGRSFPELQENQLKKVPSKKILQRGKITFESDEFLNMY